MWLSAAPWLDLLVVVLPFLFAIFLTLMQPFETKVIRKKVERICDENLPNGLGVRETVLAIVTGTIAVRNHLIFIGSIFVAIASGLFMWPAQYYQYIIVPSLFVGAAFVVTSCFKIMAVDLVEIGSTKNLYLITAREIVVQLLIILFVSIGFVVRYAP